MDTQEDGMIKDRLQRNTSERIIEFSWQRKSTEVPECSKQVGGNSDLNGGSSIEN